MKWTLEDSAGPRKGYLRILCDGERAADVFPFAPGQDPTAVRERAARMVDILNAAEPECARCGEDLTSETAYGREDGLYCDTCITAIADATPAPPPNP